MEFYMNYMEDFEIILWGIIVLFGVIMILVVWFVVYCGYFFLWCFSCKIGFIIVDKLDIRLEFIEVLVEFVNLVEFFNVMIERFESGFE